MRLLVVFSTCFLLCHGRLVTFDLSDYDPKNVTTEVKKLQLNLTRFTQIRVTEVPENVGFYVIQIHSFPQNVTLSSHPKFKPKKTISGPNVGLVSFKQNDTVFYAKNKNSTTALIVVVIYQKDDPVAGGCNLSFPTEYAPYQLVSFTDELIIVQSQPPSIINGNCDKNGVKVEMYHFYLHENNYDPFYYFSGIQMMLTPDSIQKYGHKVSTVNGYFKYRKLYSAYKGVGQVFAIVASYGNRSSAYVPAVSYGCNLDNLEGCNGPVTPHWKWLCALLAIFGVFVCFFGHRYFRITLYIKGTTLGIFVTFVILSSGKWGWTVEEKTTTSILIGLIFGAVWLLFWWKFGIPIFSAGLTFFLSGFLLASIVFYSGVADLSVFHNDANFWLTFAAIIVTLMTIWTMRTLEGHILGCSFLGAFSSVAALNYYVGGNLQYVVINTFRRIVVKNFNMATIDPPFQILDLAHSVLLVVMTTFGFYYQMKGQRGRPPFPPHRYATVEEGVNERSPLVGSSGVFYSDI